jgi:hypothetical protein
MNYECIINSTLKKKIEINYTPLESTLETITMKPTSGGGTREG